MKTCSFCARTDHDRSTLRRLAGLPSPTSLSDWSGPVRIWTLGPCAFPLPFAFRWGMDLFEAAGLRPQKVVITSGFETTRHGNRKWGVPKHTLISNLDARLHCGELRFAAAFPATY
jgi:hypothetical protein